MWQWKIYKNFGMDRYNLWWISNINASRLQYSHYLLMSFFHEYFWHRLYIKYTKKPCIYWHLHNTVNGIKSLVGVKQEENTPDPIRLFDLKLLSFPFMMASIWKQFHCHMDDAMTLCLVEQPAAVVGFRIRCLVG